MLVRGHLRIGQAGHPGHPAPEAATGGTELEWPQEMREAQGDLGVGASRSCQATGWQLHPGGTSVWFQSLVMTDPLGAVVPHDGAGQGEKDHRCYRSSLLVTVFSLLSRRCLRPWRVCVCVRSQHQQDDRGWGLLNKLPVKSGESRRVTVRIQAQGLPKGEIRRREGGIH